MQGIGSGGPQPPALTPDLLAQRVYDTNNQDNWYWIRRFTEHL